MEDGSDGGPCAILSASTSPPTEKQANCIADENESNNSSTPSTSLSNMANYPDNELSEADNDSKKQQVQPEVSINCQEVTTNINGDLDLSMSPTNERSVTTIKINGKTISTNKIDKDDEDFDNTSDNDALIIDEERLSVGEDKNKHKISDRIDNSPEKLDVNTDISKSTEDMGLIPEHSNPYFSESIFELLNKKALVSLPKKKSSVNKGSKSSQDRQSNKNVSKDYARYLGTKPSARQLLKCARCNLAGFPTVTLLNDHLVKCGSVGSFSGGSMGNDGVGCLNNNNNSRLNKKIFLCSSCATYHTQADLFLHILHTHRRYVCLYCQGMFPGAERLARHLGNRHGACRYQKQALNQQESEQRLNNNNVSLNNGELILGESVLRDSGEGPAGTGSRDNGGKTLDMRYSNIQEFRNGFKEECYLVCCGCERVFGGTGGRDDAIVAEDDRDLDEHVCERGNSSPTLPIPLTQQTTPRTITDPSGIENNNAPPIAAINPMETSQQHHTNTMGIVALNIDNVHALKSNTDSSNFANAQTQSPIHSSHGDSVRDTMQDDSRDNSRGDNDDGLMIDGGDREDRSVDEDRQLDLVPTINTDPMTPPPNSQLDPTQPDTRKVPKVTLKLTKPYQPHNPSDYSDSDSYLSDENNYDNNDNESSDSDKLTMQVSTEETETHNRTDLANDREELTENIEDNIADCMHTVVLDGERGEEVEQMDSQVIEQLENKVVQMDGGADDESTADGGGKLGEETLQDQPQHPPELAVAGSDVPVLELDEMLEQPLDKMEPQSLLRHMLLTSVPHCLYCNHTRIIPVEGCQLALHALSEHRYSATVRSITAEELIPESFNARLRECMPELRGRYFNLLNQPQQKSEDNEEVAVVVAKGSNKIRFECFQCRYQTGVHKELYQHNRKLHSKALLLCIMCKTSFLHYSELICHLCPGIYDAAPLLEPPESFQQTNNQVSGVSGVHNAITSAQMHGGTDEDTNQSANVAGAGGIGSSGGIAVPDIRFRCCLCTKDKIEPEEKKENSVWELPSAFRLMVHLRKRHHLCDVCMEPCHSQQKLANHVWKHKLNHFCYRCGIAYRNKADITKHLYWKHGTESVDCRRCLLKRWPHVYHFCQPSAQFPCDECTLTFSRAMCLRVHKRLHLPTIEQQKPYVCTWGEQGEPKQEGHLQTLEEVEENKDIKETGVHDSTSETGGVTIPNLAVSDTSKIGVTASVVCGQRFVSRKMLRKHEFRHREPKDDESEQVIVDEVDISKEDIKVLESTDKEPEDESNQLDQKPDIPASKEEIEAEETKMAKPKVDVYDLPALNLSESDSSDTEDETETKIGTDGVEPMNIDAEEIKRDSTENDLKVSVDSKKTALVNIWDNFKNYQKSKLDRQSTNPSPSTSGFLMDDEETPILTDIAPPLTEELVLRDHDYCLVTADTLNEQDPTLDDDNTQISSVDHDYCTGAKEGNDKKDDNDQHAKKNEPGAPQSSLPDKGATNSGSDSDTSSCTCGSNCSCSSSSSSDGEEDSSSDDSSSDSSSSEGRRRQQIKREKKRQKKLANKGRKTSTNITTEENSSTALNSSNNIVDVVDVVKREPVIHESDLETTESETDEDFYEEQPQRFALKLLAEKRVKLLQKVDEDLQMNGSLLGSRPVSPTSMQNTSQLPSSLLPATTDSGKKSKKSKSKKKKKKKESRRKRNRSKSHSKSSDINPSHLYAQQFQQHLQYQQQLQKQQLERQYGRQLQQSIGVVAPITLSLKQTMIGSGNSMYGTTPTAAVGGITPAQMAALGAANTMAAMGGSGSLHGHSGNSTPDDGNTRASKRRRVPNKFYGYSSDEEGNIVPVNMGATIGPGHVPKWRKIDSPKRPRSPLVVPPITIKTIPPQVTSQSQQPTIPPLRIQHKSSNSAHIRPPRQFHPPNSKYRQKSHSSKRSSTSHPTPNPPLPLLHQHPRLQQPPPVNSNDSSDDSTSDDDDTIVNLPPPPVPVAPAPVQPALPQPLQHRKGFSLQQQQQQQQRMLNSAVSIGAGVRRGPTGAIVGAGVAGGGAAAVPAAPGVALYCYCRCPYDEVSEMIGCDSDECAIEWFHFECVGIMVPPKGQWFCPDCRKRKQQRREMQLQLQQQKQHVQH